MIHSLDISLNQATTAQHSAIHSVLDHGYHDQFRSSNWRRYTISCVKKFSVDYFGFTLHEIVCDDLSNLCDFVRLCFSPHRIRLRWLFLGGSQRLRGIGEPILQ